MKKTRSANEKMKNFYIESHIIFLSSYLVSNKNLLMISKTVIGGLQIADLDCCEVCRASSRNISFFWKICIELYWSLDSFCFWSA